jgi:stage II sporulation protein M
MLFGALSINFLGDSFIKVVDNWFKSYIVFRAQKGFIEIFFSSFLSSTLYIIAIVLSSFGIGGIGLLPLLVFFRGFGTCALSGLLYRDFSLQGIAFANLILLPFFIAVDFILLYICNEALNVSFRFLDVLKDVSTRGANIRPQCLLLFKKTLVSVVFIVFVSLIESIFSISFVKYFIFY